MAEIDDHILVAYLDGENIDASELKLTMRKATLANRIVPILCGSALTNRGIRLLLDAIVNYLPSPMDMPSVRAIDTRRGDVITREAKDEAPFSALAFKVVTDPFMGRLVYLRVYSGRVKSRAQIYN